MKRVKSYSSIWNVEHVQYAIGDWNMPFPMTFTQIAWFIGTLAFVALFRNTPLLSWIDNFLIRWVAIPVGVTWFMSRKTFDGKKPYRFMKSVILYAVRPKQVYQGKRVVYRKKRVNEYITAVRREIYVPN